MYLHMQLSPDFWYGQRKRLASDETTAASFAQVHCVVSSSESNCHCARSFHSPSSGYYKSFTPTCDQHQLVLRLAF
jgi:hypothetical protein